MNGDDGSRVVVTHRPATRAFDLCGATAWDPEAATADVLSVEFRGEAEWSRGRTLALYPDQDDAVAAVETARAAVAACPEEPAGEGAASTVHTTLHVRLGDESVVWIDRFRSADLGGGFDTGLVVWNLVRVGSALLLSSEYGEGNGSQATRDIAVARATNSDRPVVEAMRDLRSGSAGIAAPPVDSLTVTPAGIGPFELGMTSDAVRSMVDGVRIDDRPPSCSELTWRGPEGARVHGAFSPGIGLAYLSTDRGTTPEGLAVGDSRDDLRDQPDHGHHR